MLRKSTLGFLLICLHHFCFGQTLIDTTNFHQLTPEERTLISEYTSRILQANDSVKIILLNELYNEMNDNDVWVEYLKLMKRTVEKPTITNTRFINSTLANFHNDYGYYYDYKGNLDSSLWHYQKSVRYSTLNKDTTAIAWTKRSIGAIYSFMGLYSQALLELDTALTNARLMNDSSEMGYIILIMGKLNMNAGEAEKGLKYLYESLSIRRKLNELGNCAVNLNDIGIELTHISDSIQRGLELLNQSTQLAKEAKDYRQVAVSLNNIGSYYFANLNLDSALVYQSKALRTMQEFHINHGVITTMANIGKIHFELGDIPSAMKYADEAYKMATKNDKPEDYWSTCELLHRLHKQLGDFKNSLMYYEKLIEAKDKINNESNQKATIRQQSKYEFEKAQLIKDQQMQEQRRKTQEETSRRNNLQYSLILIGIICLFSLFFVLGKFSIPPLVAEGLIFFAFLVLFEFLLVLADPYIENWTSGEPIYKLLANAILAGTIFPAHAFFERALKKRIVKK